MKTNTSRNSGMTPTEIMVVIAIIGSLAAIAIPDCMQSRKVAHGQTCIRNLKVIQTAKAAFAQKNGLTNGAALPCAFDPNNMIALRYCPDGGIYDMGRIGTEPTCSFPEHAITSPAQKQAAYIEKLAVCIENLRRLEYIKEFAFANGLTNGLAKYASQEIHCPAGGQYIVGAVDKPPRCSLEQKLGHVLAAQK